MQKNVLIIHGVKGVSAAKKKIIRKFVGVKRTILYLEYEVDHTGQHLIKFIKVLLNWYILSINCIHNIFYKALHILDIKPSAKLELEACCNNLLPLKTRKVSKKRIREYNQVLRGKKKKKAQQLLETRIWAYSKNFCSFKVRTLTWSAQWDFTRVLDKQLFCVFHSSIFEMLHSCLLCVYVCRGLGCGKDNLL